MCGGLWWGSCVWGSCVGGAARGAVWGNCVRELGGAVCVGLWGGHAHHAVTRWSRHTHAIASRY